MSKYETESGESQAYEYIPSLPKKRKKKEKKLINGYEFVVYV